MASPESLCRILRATSHLRGNLPKDSNLPVLKTPVWFYSAGALKRTGQKATVLPTNPLPTERLYVGSGNCSDPGSAVKFPPSALFGSLAHLVEHSTFNREAPGPSPGRPIRYHSMDKVSCSLVRGGRVGRIAYPSSPFWHSVVPFTCGGDTIRVSCRIENRAVFPGKGPTSLPTVGRWITSFPP